MPSQRFFPALDPHLLHPHISASSVRLLGNLAIGVNYRHAGASWRFTVVANVNSSCFSLEVAKP